MHKSLLAACMLAALLSATTQAQPGVNNQGRSFVEFVPANILTVDRGHKAPIAFTFRVKSPYHINSNKPLTEELIPTQLHFELPGEIAIGKVEYPAGQLESFPFDPSQKLSVYSSDVVIRALLIIPESAQPGPYTIHGELKYQACDNNACYPPKKLPIIFDVKIEDSGRNKPRKNLELQKAH